MTRAKTQTDTWFSVEAGTLAKELAVLETACERKETIPILSTVLIETSGGNLHLTTTDMDVTMETSCEARISRDHTLAVRARLLSGIVSKSRGELSFHLEGERLMIRDADAEMSLPVTDGSQYPRIDKLPEGTLSFPAKAVHAVIRQTIFAIDKEESQNVCLAALFRSDGQRTDMITNDSFRLAVASEELETEPFSIVIPKKPLRILYDLLERAETLTVSENENLLRFDLASKTLTARKLATPFTRVDAVLAAVKTTTEIEMETAAVRRAVERMGDFYDGRTRHVRLEFNKNLLAIRYVSAQNGQGKVTVPIKYTGESLVFGIDRSFLWDALKVIEAPEFILAFRNPESPVVIKSGGYRSIVVPIQSNIVEGSK